MSPYCEFAATRSRLSWRAYGVILGLSAFLGCSNSARTYPSGNVSGTVSYKGEPIAKGAITFISTGPAGDVATGGITNGVYNVHDAPVGECKIQILVQGESSGTGSTRPENQMKMMKGQMKMARDSGMQIPDDVKMEAAPKKKKKTPSAFPEKYTNADLSGLKYEVTTGTQTKDWDLP
jgi:hypothetical protein